MNLTKMTPTERALLKIALWTDDPKEREACFKRLKEISPEYQKYLKEVAEDPLWSDEDTLDENDPDSKLLNIIARLKI